MGAEEPEMETVIITRGIKVLACLFGLLAFLLLITATGSTGWAVEELGEEPFPYNAYGLFEECKVLKTPTPELIAETGEEMFNCSPHGEVPTWLLACQVLMVFAVVTSFVSFVTVAVGLCSAVEGCKFGSYRAGIYGFIIAFLAVVIVGVLYPIKFFADNEGDDFSLGWSYGLAWGMAVVLLVAALTLVFDKGEELALREKMPEEEEEEA
jgi:hypothetical protein